MRSTARVASPVGPPASVVARGGTLHDTADPSTLLQPDAPRRPAPAQRRRFDTRTVVSMAFGVVALVVAVMLGAERPAPRTAPEVAGTTISLEQRLVGLAGELRTDAGLPVPVVDPALSAAAAELEAGVGETATVEGWTVVATAVVTGTGLDDLWEQLSSSPDHRVALVAASARGWGIHVAELPDSTLRAALLVAR